MGSEIPCCKLPLIDLSKPGLNPGTPEWDSARDQVKQALEKYGCFEAFFDKVPPETRKAILDATEELYDLPSEIKRKNIYDTPFPGYFGDYPLTPLYESMAMVDAVKLSDIESFINVYYPQGNPSICQKLHRYAVEGSELDKMVRRMVLESLGVEKYLDQHIETAKCLLRVMKFKGPHTKDNKKLGLVPHTDKEFITILYHNHVSGLEVQIKDGTWISVERNSPDSFIVMFGDSFYAWTNGRYHSPRHQVMMTGDETRYTIGMFSLPKGGHIIKAPDELVDEEHPLLFKPYDFEEFSKFYLTKAGNSAYSPLHAYCGL
ncbi:probable 2-oxoglutarate-dependent dioxygenase AOP1 [Ziziphus jujuba]|uniref:Probable 2-oxoglutarate-dependent dioxygenase AOP1 n=1 Tax=Ziziphus jujuba TaxID=326968 RepID=A0ABM3I106_ZIZJJ|nr:probable 2-oxoglutarate-dependent dioxygenase AOP1 [Ziziphus jujuba]